MSHMRIILYPASYFSFQPSIPKQDLVTKKKGRFLAAWKWFFPPWPRKKSCSMLFKQVDTEQINSPREMVTFCK